MSAMNNKDWKKLHVAQCAETPFVTSLGKPRRFLDVSRIVAYRAEDQYVSALMECGKAETIMTTINLLQAEQPHMLRVSRSMLVDLRRCRGVEAPEKDWEWWIKPLILHIEGGWQCELGRRSKYCKDAETREKILALPRL